MSDKQSAAGVAEGILGRPLMISQIAVVCHDLAEDDGAVHEAARLGPVERLPARAAAAARDRSSTARRRSTRCSAPRRTSATWASSCCSRWKGRASTATGSTQHGEGLHHVAVMLHDFDESTELKKRFAEVGAAVLMGGRIGETIEFYYLDTEPSLKIILESGSGHAIDLVPDYVYP